MLSHPVEWALSDRFLEDYRYKRQVDLTAAHHTD